MIYDVFNGDADGIFSLVQLHLNNPEKSNKISGVKRDIDLLKNIAVKAGDAVRVFDISMDTNKSALITALNNGAKVLYFDHHEPGIIPKHKNLSAHIDLDPNICTALILSDFLKNKYHIWAITAAYGDNLNYRANLEADKLGLDSKEKIMLKSLGMYVNYNSYGESMDDLYFNPEQLFHELLNYSNPFEVVQDKLSIYQTLKEGYKEDMKRATDALVLHECSVSKVIKLDNASWARRIIGSFSNELANQNINKAHAVLTPNNNDSYTVSIRAPLNNKRGASTVAKMFETGGGREGAAGINALKEKEIDNLIQSLVQQYS